MPNLPVFLKKILRLLLVLWGLFYALFAVDDLYFGSDIRRISMVEIVNESSIPLQILNHSGSVEIPRWGSNTFRLNSENRNFTISKGAETIFRYADFIRLDETRGTTGYFEAVDGNYGSGSLTIRTKFSSQKTKHYFPFYQTDRKIEDTTTMQVR